MLIGNLFSPCGDLGSDYNGQLDLCQSNHYASSHTPNMTPSTVTTRGLVL